MGFPVLPYPSFRSACFHASRLTLVLGFPAIPFSASCFASQVLPQALTFPLGFRSFPLAFALGSGYLAQDMYPEN